ncbi:MAG: hypothetical protein J6S14_12545 [Clostridia bacterium]|nr:hypothetical protein [Clostridia bacterium]
MKIVINPFDVESIKDAIKQLKQYRKDFDAKEKEFVRRLAEIGVSVASTGFAMADYDGVNDVVVSMHHSGTRATIIAKGEAVGFIEFGTGVKFPEWDNSGMEYTPPKHGTYGKGHGARPHGWYFKPNGSEGAAQHTYGNIPAEAMRTARDVVIERVVQIAREVWR